MAFIFVRVKRLPDETMNFAILPTDTGRPSGVWNAQEYTRPLSSEMSVKKVKGKMMQTETDSLLSSTILLMTRSVYILNFHVLEKSTKMSTENLIPLSYKVVNSDYKPLENSGYRDSKGCEHLSKDSTEF